MTEQRKKQYKKEIPELFNNIKIENRNFFLKEIELKKQSQKVKNLKRKLSTRLKYLMSELIPRQQKVLEMRYGLVTGKFETLQEVGKYFDITRERVRHIEVEALNELEINLK